MWKPTDRHKDREATLQTRENAQEKDFSFAVHLLRFEDSEATLDAVFPPTNEDYGFILVDPPCKEIQRGELKNEHASNTGNTFKSDDIFGVFKCEVY